MYNKFKPLVLCHGDTLPRFVIPFTCCNLQLTIFPVKACSGATNMNFVSWDFARNTVSYISSRNCVISIQYNPHPPWYIWYITLILESDLSRGLLWGNPTRLFSKQQSNLYSNWGHFSIYARNKTSLSLFSSVIEEHTLVYNVTLRTWIPLLISFMW